MSKDNHKQLIYWGRETRPQQNTSNVAPSSGRVNKIPQLLAWTFPPLNKNPQKAGVDVSPRGRIHDGALGLMC